MDFILEQIRVGGDRNFGYLVGDRAARVAAAIDPAFSPELFLERAGAQGLRIAWILNTHGHGDHTNGNAELKGKTGARIAAHANAPSPPDVALADGDEVAVGSVTIRPLHVPGHTEDHLLFFLPAEKVAITGDLLFVGKVGGTSTDEEARAEYASLRRVLRELPPETTVWPGHDYGCRPSSTLALEALMNPFLRVKDFAAFLDLKRDWPRFKQVHGLR
ncbi:MAG TPA: hydroxyacylglutathione hydrolase family protein [Planctomycetota bacterium]|nr:hydroxyacylglutathione hydrolase family protein [Planctomycetota bacterium]